MSDKKSVPGQMIFGLDIGTRSIVGTVGYKSGDKFMVVAQRSKEHETRAMLDGQIHDIDRVGETIRQVKDELESVIGKPLSETCIAAAGRALKTVETHIEMTFDSEREVTEEDIAMLTSQGVEQAYEEFREKEQDSKLYYCVGYSVIRYFLNDYPISNLKGHKARVISEDMIATFLPNEVVDGLNKAIEVADLQVANMTLEPIAAIEVAIPERFRMLNIALIDVGAGTSDISITKDGSIIAYGMIPIAGDAITEVIAQHCLVDFNEAEYIKRSASTQDVITYHDILELEQTITKEEVKEITSEIVSSMAKQAAQKIKELNGDKPVSAVFVVGGGGKIDGYTEAVANEMGIAKERSALRGEEVMHNIVFLEQDTKKDSLLVTPIGICLNFYEQSNNFIYVLFNGERTRLYNNNQLAVVDAAMMASFPNEKLFPRRGKELNYSVNGISKIARGQLGEAAVITINGETADIYTPINAGDEIVVKESTAGPEAKLELSSLPEFKENLKVEVNDKEVILPKFASVKGELKSGYYDIEDGDEIQMLDYYTVGQIIQFMDVIIDPAMNIYVNNKLANKETKVYENFSVQWTYEVLLPDSAYIGSYEEDNSVATADSYASLPDANETKSEANNNSASTSENSNENTATTEEETKVVRSMQVTVNGEMITLEGKESYVFVDIFEHIAFDLSRPKGKGIVTKINGRNAQYMEELNTGDTIEVYWDMSE